MTDELSHYQLQEVRRKVADLETELHDLKEQRAKDEKRRLKAGVAALGSIVLFLGGVIWALLPASVQHAWDLVRGPR